MKPFLKWAGNKFAIIERIQKLLPPVSTSSKKQRLIEPFVGSAAVFLNTQYPKALLCDDNADLISLYQYLQKDGVSFIRFAKRFFTAQNNTPNAYYDFREAFNNNPEPLKKAALFLYFNRHGYNGLCRYNSKGGFNVPFGRYAKPYFPEAEMMGFIDALKDRHVDFKHQDFQSTMLEASHGDVVYCDPPYVPLSDTANFTSYSGNGFGDSQQQALASLAQKLSSLGIPVIISNHDTPYTQKAYEGAKIYPFQVQRFISCQGEKRNKAAEMLAYFGGERTPLVSQSTHAPRARANSGKARAGLRVIRPS